MMNDLADHLAELTAFFNASPNGIMILDEESNILVTNRAMETLTAYSMAELHRMNVRDLIPHDVPNPHAGNLSRLMAENARQIKPLSAVPLLRKDKDIIRVDVERRIYRYADVRRFGGIVTPAKTN